MVFKTIYETAGIRTSSHSGRRTFANRLDARALRDLRNHPEADGPSPYRNDGPLLRGFGGGYAECGRARLNGVPSRGTCPLFLQLPTCRCAAISAALGPTADIRYYSICFRFSLMSACSSIDSRSCVRPTRARLHPARSSWAGSLCNL